MQIPKKFTLGTLTYTVTLKPHIAPGVWGRAWLDAGHMAIATHDRRKPRVATGSKGIGCTFWHETMHAILYDMGNPLYTDELFVQAVAARLAQICETAEV